VGLDMVRLRLANEEWSGARVNLLEVPKLLT
jgi:hypothetical protein